MSAPVASENSPQDSTNSNVSEGNWLVLRNALAGPNWIPWMPRLKNSATWPTRWPVQRSTWPAFTGTRANGGNNVSENHKLEKPSTNTSEILELAHRAEKGDASAVPLLRELLSRSPTVAEMLGGNLAQQAEWSLLSS